MMMMMMMEGLCRKLGLCGAETETETEVER